MRINWFNNFKKHITLSNVFIFLLIVYPSYNVYNFIINDLDDYISLYQINLADQYFYNRNYKKYIIMYETSLKKFAKEKSVEFKLAQANFALSKNDFNYFLKGIKLLKDKSLDKSDLKFIRHFVPNQYKKKFESKLGYKRKIK